MKRFLLALKKYFDAMFYSSLQTKLAVLSFLVGSAMCLLCVFWVPPPGEISTSVIQATGMFLVLAGAAAGVKVAFDLQSQKFAAKLEDVTKRMEEKDRHRESEDHYSEGDNLF